MSYGLYLSKGVVLDGIHQSGGQMPDITQRYVVRVQFAYENSCCICHTATRLPLQGTPQDHNYEEIQMQNQQANSGNTLQSVYATVNPAASQLHYACINIKKDSVAVSTDGNVLPATNKNGSSAGDYSSVNRTQGAAHPPAAEQSLYSAVAKPGKP